MLTVNPIDDAASRAVDAAVAKYAAKNVKADEISVAIRLIGADGTVTSGGYRAAESYYPASVVKLFFLLHLADLVDKGQLTYEGELKRAAEDMIHDSNNDATGLVLDYISGTTGGPSLPEPELKEWMAKRQATNRWFQTKGITGINASQKTWNEGPYGRERQGYGPNFELRNALNPDACAEAMTRLATGDLLSPKASEFSLNLLSRKNPADSADADDQAKEFTGATLPKGYRLWSKAGWVSSERHDVALIESPGHKRVVIVIFTRKHADIGDLIPDIARQALSDLKFW